jgi:hypothetical protein
MRYLFGITLFFLLGCINRVESANCDRASAIAAETHAEQAKNWDEVYSLFLKYGACDTGGVAESFDESITLLLEKKWETISFLQSILIKDPHFEAFVIRHVSGEAHPADRMRNILGNADFNCPTSQNLLCRKISISINSSLPK